MASFDSYGIEEGGVPPSPMVISVPHAGRDYPPALIAALRGPAATPVALEDRHVDAVALAARGGEVMLIQRRARAWIDLNRAEEERDPRIDAGASPTPRAAASAKLRSGLGLVPRRAGATGELWRRRFDDDEITARIVADHRPYHATLARALAVARDRFGVAVLVDLHSMPPLGQGKARIVIGDRFGRAAGDRLIARAMACATAAGHGVALNAPYAGGHILDVHGRPGEAIHAIQLELDRSLYLDGRLDRPGPGLAATAALVGRLIAALADEAMGGGLARPLAAE